MQVTDVTTHKKQIISEIIMQCEKCFSAGMKFSLKTIIAAPDDEEKEAMIAFCNARTKTASTIYLEYTCEGSDAIAFTNEVIFDILEHILNIQHRCRWESRSSITGPKCEDHTTYFPTSYSKDYNKLFASPTGAPTSYFTTP